MQKNIKKMIYIIIGIVILAFAGFLVKYYFFNSAKIFTKGSEIVETGTVTERIINIFRGKPPLTFIVKNANNVEFKVITDFTNESVNLIREGDNVEIYGKAVKTDTISLFDSKDFYIKKITLLNKEVNTITKNSITDIYLYEDENIKQTVQIFNKTESEINFSLTSENKIEKAISSIEGIARNENIAGDLEFDDDEEGEAYPVFEYFFHKKECSIGFRLGARIENDLIENDLLTIKESKECISLREKSAPFRSVGILKKI